ncbi:MAG: GspH/FimT family pseudopilin [Sphingomonas sp.]
MVTARVVAVTGKYRRGAGFTLVELMIVIALIGLLTAAVIWALPDPRGRLADEAARFAGRVTAARDLAIAGGFPVSVWVTSGGYGFDQRRAGEWVAIAQKPLRVERWDVGTVAAFGGQSGKARVTFDPTGLTDHAATLQLIRDKASRSVKIAADGTARVGR